MKRTSKSRTHARVALIRRPIFWVLAIIVLLLLVVRLALSGVVTQYANRVLSSIPGYDARIAEVELDLWRGAYTIHGLVIERVQKQKRIPVLAVPLIDLSIEWREVLRGTLVGEIEFYRPTVDILPGPVKEEEARSADDLIQRFRELLPVRVNRFAVVDGNLHFRNYAAEPDIDIYLTNINLVARNLTNSAKISDSLAATVSADGRAMKSGRFELNMRIDPFANTPTFELAAELKGLRLPELNSYLRHYLSVEARDGLFSFYAESKAKDNAFRGYIKPFVKDLNVVKIKQDRSVPEAIKGFFVKLVSNVFENKPEEQLATKIPFSGNFESPQTSVWTAVATFLRNAFVQALSPSLEGSVVPERVQRLQKGTPPGPDRATEEERRTEEEKEELKEKR